MIHNNLILAILVLTLSFLTSCGEVVRQQETQERQERQQEIIIPESREMPSPTKLCPEWEGVWEYLTPNGVERWEGNGYNYPPQELKDSAKIVKVW